MAKLEKLSFDAYSEGEVLVSVVESNRSRTGHYPKRVLIDTIYRNRENSSNCKEHGIRMSDLALCRMKKNSADDRKRSYRDSADKRGFNLAKRCYGLQLIRTKLDTTTKSSIVLSIIVMNVDRLEVYSFAESLIFFFQCSNLDIRWYPEDNTVLGTV